MRRQDTADIIFKRVLLIFPCTILLIVGFMVFQLATSSWPAISKFGLPFLWKTTWDPVFEDFGALPFIFGTLVSSFVAMLLAIPIGLGAAIYLAEYASDLPPGSSLRCRSLAAIPA